MKRTILALIGLSLLATACSAAEKGHEENPQSINTSTTVTSTTSAPAPTTTSTTSTTSPPPSDSSRPAGPDFSPLAERVMPAGSALYEPADHVDERPVPISVTISSLDVESAPVVDVGVARNGDMEVPGADSVGWYRFSPRPGDNGSAVLAAHISFDGTPGVFRYLNDVEVGDVVRVGFDDGSGSSFEIVELSEYDKEELPFDRVFAKEGDPVLTLITCGGDFNRSLRSYDANVVAYAVPIPDPAPTI